MILLLFGLKDQFFSILQDPFFWVLSALILGGFFLVYTVFGTGNEGVSEEEDELTAELQRFGLRYVSSSVQQSSGPFTTNSTSTSTSNANTSLFADNKRKKTPKPIFQYRKVQALNTKGQSFSFWVKFTYLNGRLTRTNWSPKIEEVFA